MQHYRFGSVMRQCYSAFISRCLLGEKPPLVAEWFEIRRELAAETVFS